MSAIANRIKEIRLLKGMSQEGIAKKLRITQEAYSKIETGVSGLTLERLEEIAKILDITLVELFSFDKPTEKLSVKVPHSLIEKCSIELLPAVYEMEAAESRKKKETISDDELAKRIASKIIAVGQRVAEAIYLLKNQK